MEKDIMKGKKYRGKILNKGIKNEGLKERGEKGEWIEKFEVCGNGWE